MSAETAPLPKELNVLSIDQLKGRQFLIPAYQRGYRWTGALVAQLLHDVAAFEPATAEAFYCLQPIVVRHDGSRWEVIDGQQRLTTIWLVLRLLQGGAAPYSLDFATDARQQLSSTTLEAAVAHAAAGTSYKPASLEASYLYGAAEAIAGWQKSSQPNFAEFCDKLLHQTKVIWYETPADSGKAQDVFMRLNAGKIPLTDAELIKALLLMRRGAAYAAWQFELAAAWDMMEAALGQPDFAGWLRLPANPDGHPRLGWLLQLVEQRRLKPDAGPRALFQAVEERLKTEQAWPYWQTVENVFQRLRAWYDDPGHYHRVGYLLAVGGNNPKALDELLELAESQGRPTFWAKLNQLIAETVDFNKRKKRQDWDELAYGDDDYQLRRILLLHNVATAEQARGLSGRFPFAAYHVESWSLEHLHPQNPAGEQATPAAYQQWLRDWRTTLAAGSGAASDADPLPNDKRTELTSRVEAAQQALNEALKSTSGPDDALAQQLRELRGEYLALFSDLKPDEEHTLGNLALLTGSHNSALNNALFAEKRTKLLDLSHTSSKVVLPATLQAFLKAYTHNPDRLNRWQQADSRDYRAAVERDIRQFLTASFSA